MKSPESHNLMPALVGDEIIFAQKAIAASKREVDKRAPKTEKQDRFHHLFRREKPEPTHWKTYKPKAPEVLASSRRELGLDSAMGLQEVLERVVVGELSIPGEADAHTKAWPMLLMLSESIEKARQLEERQAKVEQATGKTEGLLSRLSRGLGRTMLGR